MSKDLAAISIFRHPLHRHLWHPATPPTIISLIKVGDLSCKIYFGVLPWRVREVLNSKTALFVRLI